MNSGLLDPASVSFDFPCLTGFPLINLKKLFLIAQFVLFRGILNQFPRKGINKNVVLYLLQFEFFVIL